MNFDPINPKPVSIAGMHRSGTSMVSRLLNLAGMDLGPEKGLLQSLAHSPTHLWENVNIVKLNEKILTHIGAGWDFIPEHLPDHWQDDSVLDPLYAEARQITSEFECGDLWGWKDPRNSITLPFWKNLFPELKIVICLRNPMEAAASLSTRTGNSIALGLNLWQAYNQTLLDSTLIKDRMITHYEAYFDNPERELKRIGNFIGMQPTSQQIESALETISAGLRNQDIPDDRLEALTSPELLNLYKIMCEESEFEVSRKDNTIYDAAQRLLQLGEIESAIAVYENLLAVDSDHADAHNDLGVLYHQTRNHDKARIHFESALRLSPDDITILKNQADLILESGGLTEAMTQYEKILQLDPTDSDTLSTLSNIFDSLGRTDDAQLFGHLASQANATG